MKFWRTITQVLLNLARNNSRGRYANRYTALIITLLLATATAGTLRLRHIRIAQVDESTKRFIVAMRTGEGIKDQFIYYMPWEDYASFPAPYQRTTFKVREVRTSITRYVNPETKSPFKWDIHGRLLTPSKASIPYVAVVMIHGGAGSEFSFLYAPDGPEKFLDLTKVSPSTVRVGIAQHIASLGIPVLAVSLPGHFSSTPWPPITTRKLRFEIGKDPTDVESENRLAVYTFRMCLEAIKTLIEKALPNHALFVWGHSTGGEYFYLLEQYGLKNRLIGDLGFGTGMPAWLRREWDEKFSGADLEDRERRYARVSGLNRRSPQTFADAGYVGPNQPWGSAEKIFELEGHRRPFIKPFLQDIEHRGTIELHDEVKSRSGLPDEELFITLKSDLKRLKGKKVLHFVGDLDKGHWMDGGEKGVSARREVFALDRFSQHADEVRLVVIPRLTHIGHIEGHNDRLGNLMVTAIKEYFIQAPALPKP
ncbi:MAG: hypothetical protein MOB07_24630 [Acidobacteria bacterium]|nr:hypothetical protein [Acidobacteriota bacterium]